MTSRMKITTKNKKMTQKYSSQQIYIPLFNILNIVKMIKIYHQSPIFETVYTWIISVSTMWTWTNVTRMFAKNFSSKYWNLTEWHIFLRKQTYCWIVTRTIVPSSFQGDFSIKGGNIFVGCGRGGLPIDGLNWWLQLHCNWCGVADVEWVPRHYFLIGDFL